MDTGRIDQAGSANTIFNKPRTPYVARFMGGQNVLTGSVEGVSGRSLRMKRAGSGPIEARIDGDASFPAAGVPISVSIRRDRIALKRLPPEADAPNAIKGVVETTEYQGSYVKVTLNVGTGEPFVANLSDGAYFSDPVDAGAEVTASWVADDVHILSEADSGHAGELYSE
jgi:putative spermidine/putrescine transport system ATP-binding protein